MFSAFDKGNGMLLLFTSILNLCLFTTTTLGFQNQSVPAVQDENAPSVDQILDRLKVHDEWQERYLIEYRAQRNFHAANLKFEEDATLEVRTTFRRPDTIESQVLRAEGSKLIRERVFDKILKAENETHSKLAKKQVDIVQANYRFSYIGQELCDDRKCYRLAITPRRKEKYLIQVRSGSMRKIGALCEFRARLQSVLHSGRGKLKSTVDTNVSMGYG